MVGTLPCGEVVPWRASILSGTGTVMAYTDWDELVLVSLRFPPQGLPH